MAFEQLTFMLYPTGWTPRSIEDRSMRYVFGSFTRLVSAEKDPNALGESVMLDGLCHWLEARAFAVQYRSAETAGFGDGRVPTLFGPYHDVEVNAHAENGKVSSVRCRFAIAADAPARLPAWERFVSELCAAFRLRIATGNVELVGPEGFIALVRVQDNWRFFAAQHAWPEAGELATEPNRPTDCPS